VRTSCECGGWGVCNFVTVLTRQTPDARPYAGKAELHGVLRRMEVDSAHAASINDIKPLMTAKQRMANRQATCIAIELNGPNVIARMTTHASRRLLESTMVSNSSYSGVGARSAPTA